MATGQRPLVGEPVSMDLVNTRWVVGSDRHDLLESLDGLRQWLAEGGLSGRFEAAPETLEHVRYVRGALARLVEEPGDGRAQEILNEVLTHGSARRFLRDGKPVTVVEFDHPSWGPAWIAADDYLRLLDAPERIRRCAHPDCVLHFFDTSKNGTRRWCSMAGCGNRAKAARHHARGRGGRTA